MTRILSFLAALGAVALAVAAGSCEDRDAGEGGVGRVGLLLGGSGLADEWRSLRVVAFDLALQDCVGPRVADPGAAPLATSGLVRPSDLQVDLSIPAGARTIYVEVYRDADGTDLLGTGCTETVLSAGRHVSVRVEIVLVGSDADADADADVPADADADDTIDGEVEVDDVDGDAEPDDAEPGEDATDAPEDELVEAPEEDVADDGDAAPPPGPVLSEIDYDQTGVDSMEFVEIYNPGPAPVSCAGLELHFINGVGSALYLTQPLTCTALDTGSVHVLGSSLLRASIPTCLSSQVLGDGGNDLVQNGPSTSGGPGDAVALVDVSSGTPVVLDQLAWEAPVTGWGEGTPAATEDASASSLQRNPPGRDTGNNAADFFVLPPTPCALP